MLKLGMKHDPDAAEFPKLALCICTVCILLIQISLSFFTGTS